METTASATNTKTTPKEVAAINEYIGHSDKYIWAIYIFLCLVSIVEIYSASSREVSANNIFGPILRQGFMLGVNICIVYGLSKVPYRWFKPMIPIFVVLSVALMVYVLLAGQIINGARRSFTIFGFMVQPSEMIKMSAVLAIALVMQGNQVRNGVTNKGVILSASIVVLFGALLFSQGLTNTILLMSISLSMMLIAGIQWRKFAIVLVCYGVVAGAGYWYKAEHEDAQNNRATTWTERLNRWTNKTPLYEQEITPQNRQEVYGYMAQANGGALGVLPGNSRETARLPLAFSDYIYSIIVEDWGFVGGIGLLFVYLMLLARAGNIARRCTRAFPAFLVLGLAVMICLQALFHMAIVTGVFPVSGQPLPMISKGGSSMLVTSLAFGVMLSVSRFAVQSGNKQDIKREKEALPESLQVENPTHIP